MESKGAHLITHRFLYHHEHRQIISSDYFQGFLDHKNWIPQGLFDFKNSTFNPRRTLTTPPKPNQKKIWGWIYRQSRICFSFQHFCFCSQIACVRTLWLFSDKTELFGREFCDRGQNIVLRVIFSSGGLGTSVNRTLSKPDPEQTHPFSPAWSLILVTKKMKLFSANLFLELPLYINPAASDAD